MFSKKWKTPIFVLHNKRACTEVLFLYIISWGKTLGTIESQIIQIPSPFQMKNSSIGSKFHCLIGSKEYLFFSHHFQLGPLNLTVFFFKHKFEIFSLWLLMFWILELQLKPKVMELGIGINLIDNSKKFEIRTSL